MATAQKTSSASAKKAHKATTLLRADHKLVEELFEQYENARSTSKKKTLVAQICKELTVHAQIEEEIFYPKVKSVLKDSELLPEAYVEHETLKNLIAQIQDVEPSGEMYDAKVKVLCEYVKHHVKEEHTEMFPQVNASSLDLYALGEELQIRKVQLMNDFGAAK